MTTSVWPGPSGAMLEPAGGSVSAGGQRLDGVVAFGDVIMVSGVGGNVTITTDRPPYRVETFPTAVEAVGWEQARQRPSRLLLAQHRVVPFVGRENDLAAVAEWMGRPGGVLVRLLHAAGGGRERPGWPGMSLRRAHRPGGGCGECCTSRCSPAATG